MLCFLNAGAALYIGGKSDSMKKIALAAEIIDSGKALETLNKLIEVITVRRCGMTILDQLTGCARGGAPCRQS